MELEQIISTAVSIGIIAFAILYVYVIIPFLRRNKRCVYDADNHKVYWLKPKFNKKLMIHMLGKIPISKDDLEYKYWIIKGGQLYKITFMQPNGSPVFTIPEVQQLLQRKLITEFYAGGIMDNLPYIIMGAIIGLLMGVIIGFYAPPRP
jgi:cbb3-type cytochrome oxidase subunit 3